MNIKQACRHFRNDKPCKFAGSCEGCDRYAPMGTRILIIKLDAVGDVARTTTILKPLRKKYSPCHITWLVYPTGQLMLRGNPEIDVLLPYTVEGLEPLRVQKFDLALCLDKTPHAAAVGAWVAAAEKLGFGLSPYGTVYPVNAESEYAFRLGLDDDLKFRTNQKTYQETIFECARLPYNRDEYLIEIEESDRTEAAAMLCARGIGEGDRVVGVNVGGGKVFAYKMWDAAGAVAFLKTLLDEVACKVLVFGAELERETIKTIMEAGLPDVFDAVTTHNCRVFQALLGRCDVVVTSDSLGMHLAIAEHRRVVVLFGPTCAQEIELYGRGEKIVSNLPCAPCYRARCERSPTCMEAIGPGEVVAAVKRQLAAATT